MVNRQEEVDLRGFGLAWFVSCDSFRAHFNKENIKDSQLGDIEKKQPDQIFQERVTNWLRQGVICLYFKRSNLVGISKE